MIIYFEKLIIVIMDLLVLSIIEIIVNFIDVCRQIQILFLATRISPPCPTNYATNTSPSLASFPPQETIFMDNISTCHTSHDPIAILLHFIQTNRTCSPIFYVYDGCRSSSFYLEESLMKYSTHANCSKRFQHNGSSKQAIQVAWSKRSPPKTCVVE